MTEQRRVTRAWSRKPMTIRMRRNSIAERSPSIRTSPIATVYRHGEAVRDAGILERHDFRDGRSRYEDTAEHHDHLIDLSTAVSSSS